MDKSPYWLLLALSAGAFAPAYADTPGPDAAIATAPPDGPLVIEAPLPAEPETIGPSVRAAAPWLTPPEERPCVRTTSLGFSRGHRVPYQGVTMAPNGVVSENTLEGSCGAFGGTTFVRLDASALIAKGYYGERGMADELRLTLGFRREVKTRLGRFDGEAFTAYRAVSGTRGFTRMDDDYSDVGFSVGYPMTVRGWKLRPYFIAVKENPINYANSLYFWGFGATATHRFLFGSTLRISAANIRDENSTTAVLHKYATSTDLSLEWPLGRQLAFSAGVRHDRYAAQDARYELCAERDNRIVRCGTNSVPIPQLYPFIALSHRTLF